jgi:signal transduction histidine kinase/ligand-binding sensor domain-containing protein
MVRPLVVAAGALVIATVCATPSRAASALTEYTLTVWASEKGLPPGDVFALTQDADGYLWVGTPTGLLRFDGAKFVSWSAINEQDPLPAGPVHVLIVARDKSLWVGLGGGGGVVRIAHGHVTRYHTKDGAPPGVDALLEDREGTIWAAGRRGLFRFARGAWSAVGSESGFPQSEVFSVYEDRAGALWVGTAAGVYRRTNGRFSLVDAEASNAQSIAEDPSGTLWVTDTSKVVMRLADHAVPRHDPAAVQLPLSGWRLLADRRGQVWVAAFGGGVMRIVPESGGVPAMERFPYEHRLAGSPRSLYEDRDGNIWIGMRGGLVRLSERVFDNTTRLDGLTHDGVRTTALGADGSVWVATGLSVNRFLNGARSVYRVPQTFALHGDRHGALWASTTQGLFRFTGDRFSPVAMPPVQWSRVASLTTDGHDTLWLCSTLRGVMTWDGHVLSRFDQVPDIADRACQSTLTDAQGRVWIGFQAGGVAVYENGAFRVFGDSDGLTRGTVLAIMQDKAGAIWFVTQGGMSRYQNGRITSITQANAPLVDLVPVLAEDAEGYIWAGVESGLGLVRFHPSEVDQIAAMPSHRLEYALYDDTDGLDQAPLTWQSGVGSVRGPDGRLWVTSGPGIVVIDPRTLPRGRRPPPPYIESVLVNGRLVGVENQLRLPAGSSTLKIGYTAVSLSLASKLRFRYRLDGVDHDWVYAGPSREASYAGLSSGDYRFRVSATHDGQWTEAGQWDFSVAPPLYMTRWFLALAAAITLALIGAAWLLRMRVVKQRYALVFAERARVSREIHDTLLQSLAGLSVELEAIATQVDPSQQPVRDALRRLRREVGHALRDARESILELRRDAMTTRDVADALRDVAHRTRSAKDATVEVSVSGRRPAQCPADVDLQLFRIGQEAIANALRHGHASRVDIAVRYEKDCVVLKVHDNGCGFAADGHDPRRATGEHLGLVTMRERAARLRGRVDVVSRPGAGTTIEAMIPVAAE